MRRITLAPRAILIAVGAALILAGSGTAVWANWAEVRYALGMTPTSYPYPTKLHPGAKTKHRARPKIDRLVIPRLSVDVPIGEGHATPSLKKGVWRVRGTAKPGKKANCALAGHRTQRVFALLGKLRRGDEIILYWRRREYDYRVVTVREFGPSDTEILRAGWKAKLTLYTCIPRFLGNKRTVVVAVPIRR